MVPHSVLGRDGRADQDCAQGQAPSRTMLMLFVPGSASFIWSRAARQCISVNNKHPLRSPIVHESAMSGRKKITKSGSPRSTATACSPCARSRPGSASSNTAANASPGTTPPSAPPSGRPDQPHLLFQPRRRQRDRRRQPRQRCALDQPRLRAELRSLRGRRPGLHPRPARHRPGRGAELQLRADLRRAPHAGAQAPVRLPLRHPGLQRHHAGAEAPRQKAAGRQP
jgi:hypothetical protein